MLESKIKQIVASLTDEVVNRLKEDGGFDDDNKPKEIDDTNGDGSYIKLTKVSNGYILELSNDDLRKPPTSEVIEIDDMEDPESIVAVLYGVSEWLGIENNPKSSKNINITFDGVGETYDKNKKEPPGPLEQRKYKKGGVDNTRYIEDQGEVYIPPKPEPEKPKKPHEITKEDVIRAAMGLSPEDTVHEDELSPAEKLGIEEVDYTVKDESELLPNEYVESDLNPEQYEELTDDQYKELEELPDGDFDENEDDDGDYEDEDYE